MIDSERRLAIKTLTSLYNQKDFNSMVERMPKEVSDPDGKLFEQYFDLLQSFYLFRGEYSTLEEEEALAWAGNLKSQAKSFGLNLTALDAI